MIKAMQRDISLFLSMFYLIAVLAILADTTSAKENKCHQQLWPEECEDHANCEWATKESICIPKGQPVPCAAYGTYEECTAIPYCTYHIEAHSCYPKDGPPPCDLLGGEVCEAQPGCMIDDSTSGGCSAIGHPVPCHSILRNNVCDARDDCAFYYPQSFCYDKDDSPCTYIYDGDGCNKAAADCEWHDSALHCFKKGFADCSKMPTEQSCSTTPQCIWSKQINRCQKEGTKTYCSLLPKDECTKESDRCEYAEEISRCKRIGDDIPCAHYMEEKFCTANPKCQYNKLATRCHNVDQTAPCAWYGTAADCEEAGCDFYRYSCHPHGLRKPCKEIVGSHTCEASGCVYLPSGDCVDTEYAREHDNKPPQHDRAFYEENKPHCENVDCGPAPTCGHGESLRKAAKECCVRCSFSQATCLKFEDAEHCPPKCELDELTQVCVALGQKPPCTSIEQEANCNIFPRCSWHKSAKMCLAEGQRLDCHDIYHGTLCDEHGDIGCVWNVEGHVCHHKGVEPSCDSFSSSTTCPKKHCEWLPKLNLCLKQGDLPPCQWYQGEDECKETKHCKFSKETQKCIRLDETPECKDIVKKYCAHTDGCGWNDIDYTCDNDLEFAPVPCNHIWNEQECLRATEEGKPCIWDKDPQVMRCHAENSHPPCRSLPPAVCKERQYCKYYPELPLCTELDESLSCAEIMHQKLCETHDCAWEPNIHRCYAKDGAPECSFYYSASLCHQSAPPICKWDNEIGTCMNTTALHYCIDVHNPSTCRAQANCEWDIHAETCGEIGNPLECHYYFEPARCASAKRGCYYHPGAQACIPLHSIADCGWLYTKKACTHEPGCGWDFRRQQCRKLQLERDEL